jgi:hypothetical protein
MEEIKNKLSKEEKHNISYKKYYNKNKSTINDKRKLIKNSFKIISARLEKKLSKIWRIKRLIC